MRKILFRGKRIDNGEWVYGLLWKKKFNTKKVFIHFFPNEDDEDDYAVVIPETIGQYTGIKDNNDKKIFEGDIVRINNSEDCLIISFDTEHDGCFICSNKKKYPYYYHRLQYKNAEYEVVGNIHDNPELLND